MALQWSSWSWIRHCRPNKNPLSLHIALQSDSLCILQHRLVLQRSFSGECRTCTKRLTWCHLPIRLIFLHRGLCHWWCSWTQWMHWLETRIFRRRTMLGRAVWNPSYRYRLNFLHLHPVECHTRRHSRYLHYPRYHLHLLLSRILCQLAARILLQRGVCHRRVRTLIWFRRYRSLMVLNSFESGRGNRRSETRWRGCSKSTLQGVSRMLSVHLVLVFLQHLLLLRICYTRLNCVRRHRRSQLTAYLAKSLLILDQQMGSRSPVRLNHLILFLLSRIQSFLWLSLGFLQTSQLRVEVGHLGDPERQLARPEFLIQVCLRFPTTKRR